MSPSTALLPRQGRPHSDPLRVKASPPPLRLCAHSHACVPTAAGRHLSGPFRRRCVSPSTALLFSLGRPPLRMQSSPPPLRLFAYSLAFLCPDCRCAEGGHLSGPFRRRCVPTSSLAFVLTAAAWREGICPAAFRRRCISTTPAALLCPMAGEGICPEPSAAVACLRSALPLPCPALPCPPPGAPPALRLFIDSLAR